MPQIFVSYSDPDRDAGKSLVSVLQKAGFEVSGSSWIGAGEDCKDAIQGQIESASCFVMLWSSAAAQSKWVQQEVQRAIQAWSNARLVVATLDDAELPVGLRDLQALAIATAAEGLEWTELVNRVKTTIDQQAHAQAESPSPTAVTKDARLARRLTPLHKASISAALLLVLGSLGYQVYRHFAFEPHARDLSSSNQSTYVVVLLILGIAIGAGATWVWSTWPRRSQSTSGTSDGSALLTHGSSIVPHVFVSYSRSDTRAVEQLVERIAEAGHEVWIDREAGGSQRYAASIVRAIREAQLVALMCSRNSFASDHVIREVYVAGDHKKPFIVFQLDQAEFPDEVLYFISGFPRVSVAALDQQRLQSEISRLLVSREVERSSLAQVL